MKIKVISIPESTIEKFADKYGLEMVVRKRSCRMAHEHGRYFASFDGVDIVGDGVLVSAFGNGDTQDGAICDYGTKISEQPLRISSGDHRITCPRIVTSP